jgi:hypothetical protein
MFHHQVPTAMHSDSKAVQMFVIIIKTAVLFAPYQRFFRLPTQITTTTTTTTTTTCEARGNLPFNFTQRTVEYLWVPNCTPKKSTDFTYDINHQQLQTVAEQKNAKQRLMTVVGQTQQS